MEGVPGCGPGRPAECGGTLRSAFGYGMEVRAASAEAGAAGAVAWGGAYH